MRAKPVCRPVLEPDQREVLNRSMFARVLGQVAGLPGDNELIVISPEQDALDFGRELRPEGTFLLQRADAILLNGALDQATAYALDLHLRAVLIVPTDLPFVTTRDLEHLLRRDAPVVVAPDRRSEGTNSLMQRLDATRGRFRYHFGLDSYRKHLAEAHRIGLDPATAISFGTSFDLDTPRDLSDAEALGIESVAETGVACHGN